ncbi:hypothetical protein E4Z66_00445 [Aliishimia ponticola]|uniref:Uncharacterized protein n=1 Tax=Aliishimia ponticola TaxID=2499833 RepID=A0A4V3XKS6_9RHOB|nr:hypothetical protein [Aliishimia ponticola]THH38083.1 hypothetical protein E4Z66_00445 [Aliishimia ponticola]
MYEPAPKVTDADRLAREIRESSTDRRIELQPLFGRMLQGLEESGVPVPARMRNLHEQLLEEAIEAKFDNLPV